MHDVDQARALIRAAEQGDKDSVVDLISEVPCIDCTDAQGYSALSIAAVRGHTEICEILLRRGANVDHVMSLGTPLFLAAGNGHALAVDLLIQHGADVCRNNIRRETALHRAATFGHYGICMVLIQNGANVNARDDDKGMPIHYAAGNRHLRVVRLLTESGTDFQEICLGVDTPLHSAVKGGNREIVEFLASRVRNINSRGFEGLTALKLARNLGPHWEEISEVLTAHGGRDWYA